jgi:hypothetical protein
MSQPEIFDMAQNSPEWFAARCGIPTASQFATIMAKGNEGGASKTRATYMRKLAGEIITGIPAESFSNVHTERGHAMEGEARDYYAFLKDAQPERVGFIRNGNVGGSPDSLLGSEGLLEIKTALPHILIEHLQADKFPAEHVAQCQGNLWISGREWIDIIVYWPKMPVLIKRAPRDEVKIAEIKRAVSQFSEELAQLVEFLRGYGMEKAA